MKKEVRSWMSLWVRKGLNLQITVVFQLPHLRLSHWCLINWTSTNLKNSSCEGGTFHRCLSMVSIGITWWYQLKAFNHLLGHLLWRWWLPWCCFKLVELGHSSELCNVLYSILLYLHVHNILEPTTGVTFFNSGFKSDPTELFSFIVLVIAG
jgi:hypothetical protein